MVKDLQSWFILYTKPEHEKKVTENLTKKGFEAYLPLMFDVKKAGKPLFTSFVFVKCESEQLIILKNMSAVLNCAYWQGNPATVSEDEIVAIKRILRTSNKVIVDKIAVDMSATVKIEQDTSVRRDGKIVHVNNSVTSVELPGLGFKVCLVNEPAALEVDSYPLQRESLASTKS